MVRRNVRLDKVIKQGHLLRATQKSHNEEFMSVIKVFWAASAKMLFKDTNSTCDNRHVHELYVLFSGLSCLLALRHEMQLHRQN